MKIKINLSEDSHIVNHKEEFLEYMKSISYDFERPHHDRIITNGIHIRITNSTEQSNKVTMIPTTNERDFIWVGILEFKEWLYINSLIDFKRVSEITIGYIIGIHNPFDNPTTYNHNYYELHVKFAHI